MRIWGPLQRMSPPGTLPRRLKTYYFNLQAAASAADLYGNRRLDVWMFSVLGRFGNPGLGRWLVEGNVCKESTVCAQSEHSFDGQAQNAYFFSYAHSDAEGC